MKLILTFILITISFSVFSQVNLLEEKIKKEINYNDDDYFSFEIKNVPNDSAKSIAILTKYNGNHNADGFDCDLILMLIDNNSGEAINKLVLKNEYGSDAVALNNISLDMANYTVKENVRAFGIRSNYTGSSSVFPYNQENISLFIIQNNKIFKILGNFECAVARGETDIRCNSEYEDSNSVFIIQNKKTNGFYNISVMTKTIKTKSVPSKTNEDDCIETKTELKPTTKTLIFSNGKYQLRKK